MPKSRQFIQQCKISSVNNTMWPQLESKKVIKWLQKFTKYAYCLRTCITKQQKLALEFAHLEHAAQITELKPSKLHVLQAKV